MRTWKKGTLVHCCGDRKPIQSLRKTLWRILKILKIELPYNPAIPLLGIYPTETKTLTWKRQRHPRVQSSLIYDGQDMETTKCRWQMNGWSRGMYLPRSIQPFWKKEGSPAICNSTNRPWGHVLSEISQKSNIVWFHLNGESKQNNPPPSPKEKKTNS